VTQEPRVATTQSGHGSGLYGAVERVSFNMGDGSVVTCGHADTKHEET
jgi:hypothetical protein